MRAFQQGWLVPEVRQKRLMDCGPAALIAILHGFGIRADPSRVEDLCEVDDEAGTSISRLEEVAHKFGLSATQIIMPLFHVQMGRADVLPGIFLATESGRAHFIVIWRRSGSLVQVMNPWSGRCWMKREDLSDVVRPHVAPVSARAWREWVFSSHYLPLIKRCLRRIGISDTREVIEEAKRDRSWRSIARVDAAARHVAQLQGQKRLAAKEGRSTFEKLIRADDNIPLEEWPVTTGSHLSRGQVLLQGALILQIGLISA